MKKTLAVLVGSLLLGSTLLVEGAPQQSSPPPGAAVLEFKTMTGVSGPFKGTANPIRGINGGGLAWMIADGRGSLKADGTLDVHVKGLVFAEGPNQGTNTIPFFRAIVSCRTIDGMGNAAFSNAMTDSFPASVPAGDAMIQAQVELPSPCVAPIIFVTSPTGSWFAVTGM